MTALVLVLVALTAAAVVWLAYEVLRLRSSRSDASRPGRLVQEMGEELASVEEILAELEERVLSLEDRLPRAIQHVGAVAYDAYGDVAGALSRSIALLNEEGSGLVISQLVGRHESRLFVKGVRHGRGEEPLSPEEAEAVRLAMEG